jgi:hypothetical protein
MTLNCRPTQTAEVAGAEFGAASGHVRWCPVDALKHWPNSIAALCERNLRSPDNGVANPFGQFRQEQL